MLLSLLRWLGKNVGTLLLAFILAVVVWVSAVTAADPNVENVYRPVPLEQKGLSPDMMLSGSIPSQVRLTLEAPQTIWTLLNNNPDLVHAWIDFSSLGPGEHTVPVHVDINASPVRIKEVDPQTVHFTLETLVNRKFPVQMNIDGDPPLGYRKGTPASDPSEVAISGPESLVSKVAEVRISLNVAGSGETVKATVPAVALDKNGDPVPDVTITPKTVKVTQPVNLLRSYKNLVVKVVTTGQIANGYRLTNISVSPLNVTVFSANPQYVNELPGYVETKPINLNGLKDDIEVRVELNLPPEITLVGEQSVLVQIGVAAIEGSLTVTLPVEALGLPPELAAHISPTTVDVIVSGPLPVLDTLSPASFRAVVDLTGLAAGTYQLPANVDLVPEQVQIQPPQPETVEVIIEPAPTPTPTRPAQTTSASAPQATSTPTAGP